MSTWTYSASNEANLMKIKYGKLIDKQFNMENPLFARIKVKEDFVGSSLKMPVVRSIGGGVSSGTLPTANENLISQASLSAKKMYAATSIDRESMKAAKTDEGAFVRFTAFPVKIAVEAFNRNLERIITVGDASGSGALITGNASNTVVSGAGSACDPYVVTFDASGIYYDTDASPFEVGDFLNVNAETTDLEITDITVTTTSVALDLVGTSSRLATLAACCGTAFGASDKLYMQNSKDNEMVGLRGAIAATSGSLYGITVGRRWQAYQKNASSAALTTDLINEMVIKTKQNCGKAPKMILTSYNQYIKLLNLLEDHKRYDSIKARRADVSFRAVQVMTPEGEIPVVSSRFVPADEMYFLNDDHLELHLRPGGLEWFDEDGTVFLRNASSDAYDARYGGYGQFFVNPHFQAYLHTLAV
jgi:hypothetical protein